jgi:large subunit ribosomal protein L21
MFAVIELGGRQFSVEKGTHVRCELLDKEPNTTFAVDRVLMVKDGTKVQVGQPYLKGVEVRAKVMGHGRAKKVLGLKYKSKVNYRRKYGHRQNFTAVIIEDISC